MSKGESAKKDLDRINDLEMEIDRYKSSASTKEDTIKKLLAERKKADEDAQAMRDKIAIIESNFAKMQTAFELEKESKRSVLLTLQIMKGQHEPLTIPSTQFTSNGTDGSA